jgi:hypothetical protein
MAIMILGVVVVAIGACIAFAVKASGIHRNQALADQYLHNYAEFLQTNYKQCAGTPAATGPLDINDIMASPIGKPASFGNPTATIAFWDGTSAKFATRPTGTSMSRSSSSSGAPDEAGLS